MNATVVENQFGIHITCEMFSVHSAVLWNVLANRAIDIDSVNNFEGILYIRIRTSLKDANSICKQVNITSANIKIV